jgi:hypothetical protein
MARACLAAALLAALAAPGGDAAEAVLSEEQKRATRDYDPELLMPIFDWNKKLAADGRYETDVPAGIPGTLDMVHSVNGSVRVLDHDTPKEKAPPHGVDTGLSMRDALTVRPAAGAPATVVLQIPMGVDHNGPNRLHFWVWVDGPVCTEALHNSTSWVNVSNADGSLNSSAATVTRWTTTACAATGYNDSLPAGPSCTETATVSVPQDWDACHDTGLDISTADACEAILTESDLDSGSTKACTWNAEGTGHNGARHSRQSTPRSVRHRLDRGPRVLAELRGLLGFLRCRRAGEGVAGVGAAAKQAGRGEAPANSRARARPLTPPLALAGPAHPAGVGGLRRAAGRVARGARRVRGTAAR